MRKYDALCLPIKTYTPKQIKRLREQCQLDQATFAAFLNTKVTTVRKWEQGQQTPSSSFMKLLSLVEAHGLEGLI